MGHVRHMVRLRWMAGGMVGRGTRGVREARRMGHAPGRGCGEGTCGLGCPDSPAVEGSSREGSAPSSKRDKSSRVQGRVVGEGF